MDAYEFLSAAKLRRWAENELEVTDDDPAAGETLVARGVLALLDRHETEFRKQLLPQRQEGLLKEEPDVDLGATAHVPLRKTVRSQEPPVASRTEEVVAVSSDGPGWRYAIHSCEEGWFAQVCPPCLAPFDESEIETIEETMGPFSKREEAVEELARRVLACVALVADPDAYLDR